MFKTPFLARLLTELSAHLVFPGVLQSCHTGSPLVDRRGHYVFGFVHVVFVAVKLKESWTFILITHLCRERGNWIAPSGLAPDVHLPMGSTLNKPVWCQNKLCTQNLSISQQPCTIMTSSLIEIFSVPGILPLPYC